MRRTMLEAMAAARTHRLLLWAAATDDTFRRRGDALVGKCIHCRRKLALELDGRPISEATLEHIVPKNHGGTDALENLAVACKSCNNAKGHRHDHARADDPTLRRVIATLTERRRERCREPLPGLCMPPFPA